MGHPYLYRHKPLFTGSLFHAYVGKPFPALVTTFYHLNTSLFVLIFASGPVCGDTLCRAGIGYAIRRYHAYRYGRNIVADKQQGSAAKKINRCPVVCSTVSFIINNKPCKKSYCLGQPDRWQGNFNYFFEREYSRCRFGVI